jgi:uncharacterized membrane protein YtjA (UPF0391 family)
MAPLQNGASSTAAPKCGFATYSKKSGAYVRAARHFDGTAHAPSPPIVAITLHWAVVPIASAAVLGFGGIAGTAVGLAKIVFFLALVLFLISLLFGGFRGRFRGSL